MTVTMAGGEVAPAVYGRVDLATYGSWLKTCLNWWIKPAGGVETRSGTSYTTTSKTTGDKIRLIPFVFNSEQSFVLEFGDHYMRVMKDGAVVPSLVTVTDQNFGTGDGNTKAFQLHGASGHIYTPQTVAVKVAGVLMLAAEDVNLCTYPEDLSDASWVKGSGVTVTANSWTGPGAGGATGDTLNWSA